jgi:hypothetical protein
MEALLVVVHSNVESSSHRTGELVERKTVCTAPATCKTTIDTGDVENRRET